MTLTLARKLSLPLAALGAMLLASACGGTSSDSPAPSAGSGGQSSAGSGGKASVPEAEAAHLRAVTRCHRVFECCDPTADHGGLMLQVYRFATEDECVATYEPFFEDAQDRSRAAGLTYHPECLALEIAAEAAFGCNETQYWKDPPVEFVLPRSCAGAIYHGDRAEGEGCGTYLGIVRGADVVAPSEGGNHCQKGLSCDVGLEVATTGDSNSGICRVIQGELPMFTTVGIGEACSFAVTCDATEAFCDDDGTQTCTALLPAGASCLGGACAADFFCKGQLTGTGSATFTCVAKLTEGAACDGLQCGDGMYCPSWETDVAARICTPWVPVGGACRFDPVCEHDFCREVCYGVRPAPICLWEVPEP